MICQCSLICIVCGIGAFPVTCHAALYGMAVAGPDRLFRIDPSNAGSSLIGVVSPVFDPGALTGLAYDSQLDNFLAVSPGGSGSSALYRIDRNTAGATPIGALGLPYRNVNGLALDHDTRTLYATDNTTNSLLRIDISTGLATGIATIGGGFREIEGLGFDPRGRVLYGITQLQRQVVRIDVHTGLATAILQPLTLPAATWRGLDFDPQTGLLYATAGNMLYSIQPEEGSVKLVGAIPGASAVQGLASVPSPSALFAAVLAGGWIATRRNRGGVRAPASAMRAASC